MYGSNDDRNLELLRDLLYIVQLLAIVRLLVLLLLLLLLPLLTLLIDCGVKGVCIDVVVATVGAVATPMAAAATDAVFLLLLALLANVKLGDVAFVGDGAGVIVALV